MVNGTFLYTENLFFSAHRRALGARELKRLAQSDSEVVAELRPAPGSSQASVPSPTMAVSKMCQAK